MTCGNLTCETAWEIFEDGRVCAVLSYVEGIGIRHSLMRRSLAWDNQLFVEVILQVKFFIFSICRGAGVTISSHNFWGPCEIIHGQSWCSTLSKTFISNFSHSRPIGHPESFTQVWSYSLFDSTCSLPISNVRMDSTLNDSLTKALTSLTQKFLPGPQKEG